MSTKTEKRSWSVYGSDAEGSRGELIAHAKSKSWSNVAKKWGFRKLDRGDKSTWTRVELRLPGRGEKPAKLYNLKREMTTPNEGYLAIAESRGYKSLELMPKISIVGKPKVLVSNKRKPAAVARSRSASPKPKEVKKKSTRAKKAAKVNRSASPAPAASRSASPAPKAKTGRKKRAVAK